MFNNLLRKLIATGLIAAAGVLTSCDSGGQNNSLISDADTIAEAFDPSEFRPGDQISYVTVNATPLITVPVAIGTTPVQFPNSTDTLVYTLTGQFTFRLTIQRQAETRVAAAFVQLFDGDTELGSRIRRLMLRREADFTLAEYQTLARDLSALNAPTRVLPDSSGIYFEDGATFIHEVTSTIFDQANGAMGGNYTVNVTGRELGFRQGSPTDGRFITNEHLVPILTTTNVAFDNVEVGTWIIELAN